MSQYKYKKERLPIIFLKDTVLFPGVVNMLSIQRPRSINALNAIIEQVEKEGGYYILCATQKKPEVDDLSAHDVYYIGVLAKILQVIKLPGDTLKILITPEQKVSLKNLQLQINDDGSEYYEAKYVTIKDEEAIDANYLSEQVNKLIQQFNDYVKVNKKLNAQALNSLTLDQRNPVSTLYIIASHLTCSVEKRQKLLEFNDFAKCVEYLIELLIDEIASIEAARIIQMRVAEQNEQTHRNYHLHEQMKAIQKELGEFDEKSEISELERKINSVKLSKEAKEKALSELRKLGSMNASSGEAIVIRNYLDTLLSLPWGIESKEKIDLQRVTEILDRDHYGLNKVKERIIEYIAVLQRRKGKLNADVKGTILCLIGPPGIGKTSLVESIAEAIGRQYTKFALGGVRDEAEIRGHRRTYLGSLPGKPIQLLRKIKVNNPIILLDEIDKLGADYRGDPAAALLELLDPEQNSRFLDHYLDVEYDMSKVMFIATANSPNMPRALLDRLEIINVSGYIEDEKLQIAQNYLVPKGLAAQGLKEGELFISEEVIRYLIKYYTRESGVRGLGRTIATLARKTLKSILNNQAPSPNLTIEKVEELLGPRKYKIGLIEEQDLVGITTGLAYTELGGDLLLIEAITTPGKGEIKATGTLGDVMKESIQAAFSFFCARAANLGIKPEEYKSKDIHIHVPEGAIPKDGPSAGIAIFTTIVSVMTNIPVNRRVAMTGEITLRGRVLPIGGLTEKLQAALRGGITTVIIPAENQRDLIDIPNSIKNGLIIKPVTTAEEVLEIALTHSPFVKL